MKQVGILLTIALAIGMPSPASELRAALADAASVSPSDRPYTRYLSLYTVPEEDKQVAREVASFWVNSLSLMPRIVRPIEVTENLLRLDLRNYGWDVDDWETLVDKRGYEFVPVWRPIAKSVSDPFQTRSPVLRLEGFLVNSSEKQFYDKFLNLGQKLAEVQTAFRVRIDDGKALRLDVYGSKFRSPVALHNRRLIRYPSLSGYWWESQDHLTDFGPDNIVDNLEVSDHDAGEFIWSLPNGLQAYYIADGKGAAVQVVPAAIAQDYETPAKDKQIYNARSCVGCHGKGIKAFDDDVAAMIKSGTLKLNTHDRETYQRLGDHFLSDLPVTIEKDQARFAEAVAKACELEPENVAHEFRRITVEYIDRPVTREMIARELGIASTDLEKLSAPYRGKRIVSATFAAILAGQPVSRQAWENMVGTAIALVHQL